MSRANLDKQPRDVASMFDGVAKRYDLTNTILSGGMDHVWRRRARSLLAPRPGERILDLAAGTAVSTVELARSGAWCVACLLYTSPSPRDRQKSRMPSSA